MSKIAIVTGTQKELDGIDLFARICPIDYVVTVEALKEGWDCSFAYVFCSVSRIQSAADVEQLDDAALAGLFPSDCWIFGDCLEHLRDPWRVLTRIRERIDGDGSLVTCIPNAQHWSVQVNPLAAWT